MYRLPLILFLAFLSLITVAISYKQFHISGTDRTIFAEIEAKAKNSQASHGGSPATFAQQVRQKVSKEFWLNQRSKRQLIRILSSNSELFFFPEGKNMEIVEQMDDVNCLIQEELYYIMPNGQEVLTHNGDQHFYLRGKSPEDPNSLVDPKKVYLTPMQKFRTLKASKACYNYSTNLFIADNVKMWTYEIKGHEIPHTFKHLKPIVESTAESVEFSLYGEAINLKAHRLKAHFQSPSQKS